MEKYLRIYAEPEIHALDDLPEQAAWENVLVIPACNETAEFLRPPPPCGGRSLLILVINESGVASRQVSASNQALAREVRSRFRPLWKSAPGFSGFELSLFRDAQSPRDILLVDRFNQGRKLSGTGTLNGSVGQARKIGADLATGLIHRKRVYSPWIHCSDADVQLPDTYFTCSNAVQNTIPGASALVYPFRHGASEELPEDDVIELATRLYEFSLRYYVAGMRFACSPYAFHTIGSTMAVRAIHYAKVRGFPKREAGEDFYLLNKLAKLGSVIELEEGPDCQAIRIEARLSDRVPFGTGAAVNKIIELDDPVNDFRFYNPAVFELLQHWLSIQPAIWQSGSTELGSHVLSVQSDAQDQFSNHQSLLNGLKKIGAEKALEHAFKQSKDLDQFTRQMHTWFDAFRTLKLIHFLRDHQLPSINFATLSRNQAFQHLMRQDQQLMDFHTRLPLIYTQNETLIIGSVS